MNILSFYESDSEKVIRSALKVLDGGGIIAYPTESFYALGVSATDDNAVKRLCEIKRRSSEKPLPLIISDIDSLYSVVKEIPDQASRLIEKYWPGPLTIIFEADENLPSLITGGTGKVAVRIPGESVALQVAKAVKMPVTATSANLSSMPPAINIKAVLSYFGDNIDLILDGGWAPGGKPSTIIDLTVTPARILRKGSIKLNY